MDLKGMAYVIAVAETGSFTRAAQLKYVAQPALSRKVAALENELGVALFSRDGRGAKLTAAGQVFCHWAKQVMRDCDSLNAAMEQCLIAAQTLRLVYFTNGSVPYVAKVVSDIHQKYPQIQVISQSASSLSLSDPSVLSMIEQLRQRNVDLLFTFLPEVLAKGREWMGWKSVEKGGLCAFVGDGHPLLKGHPPKAAELHSHTLIFPPERYDPLLTDAMCQALDMPPRVAFSRDSTDFRVQIITEGYVGVMPASSRTIESRFLHCLPICDVQEGFDLIAAWNKENKSPILEKFLNNL